MKIKIKRLENYPSDWALPEYSTPGAACFDLRAIVPEGVRRIYSFPVKFKTGLAFQMPDGYFMSIRSRSGLGFKRGIVGFDGTIDSDFRDQVSVLLYPITGQSYEVHHGDRIAQAVILPCPRIEWEEVDELSETVRGLAGFGSTGR